MRVLKSWRKAPQPKHQPRSMKSDEDFARLLIEGEMIASGVTKSTDGTLTTQIMGRTYMIELRVLDVTE